LKPPVVPFSGYCTSGEGGFACSVSTYVCRSLFCFCSSSIWAISSV
jgi:hypothetical protein